MSSLTISSLISILLCETEQAVRDLLGAGDDLLRGEDGAKRRDDAREDSAHARDRARRTGHGRDERGGHLEEEGHESERHEDHDGLSAYGAEALDVADADPSGVVIDEKGEAYRRGRRPQVDLADAKEDGRDDREGASGAHDERDEGEQHDHDARASLAVSEGIHLLREGLRKGPRPACGRESKACYDLRYASDEVLREPVDRPADLHGMQHESGRDGKHRDDGKDLGELLGTPHAAPRVERLDQGEAEGEAEERKAVGLEGEPADLLGGAVESREGPGREIGRERALGVLADQAHEPCRHVAHELRDRTAERPDDLDEAVHEETRRKRELRILLRYLLVAEILLTGRLGRRRSLDISRGLMVVLRLPIELVPVGDPIGPVVAAHRVLGLPAVTLDFLRCRPVGERPLEGICRVRVGRAGRCRRILSRPYDL